MKNLVISRLFIVLTISGLGLPCEYSHAKVSAAQKFKEIGLELKKKSYITLDFKQETYRAIRKKTRVSRGKAVFAKPNKLRWTLLDPSLDEWIFDGRSLLHHQSDKNQAVSYHMTTGRAKEFRNLINMVLDTSELTKEFNVQVSKMTDLEKEFILRPHKPNGQLKSMVVRYDVQKQFLNKVVMEFEGGNRSTFVFSNPSYHQVSGNKFQLPATVKVVKGL